MSTSVGSLSTSTSTSIRGYGGLASGLDRDELIKGMTMGTTNKITQQEQKKQQLQWKQEAVQSISSTMIDFHSKYTETLTSPTNLFSAMLWGRNKITTSGVNSKYVSVTGAASGADAITIMGIKQKAEDAKWSSSAGVSSGELKTGKIQIDTTNLKAYTQENLAGKSISFKYGDSSYSIYLSDSDEYSYKNVDEIVESINKLLEKQTTSNDKKLSTIIQATKNGDGTLGFQDVGSGGNHLELTGGSALELLGLREKAAEGEKEGKIKNDGIIDKDSTKLSGEVSKDITKEVSFYEYVAGKSLNFSYNGTSTTVTMPGAEELEAAANKIWNDLDNNINNKNDATIKAIADSIQEQLDKAFGKGRIEVNGDGGELSFKTTIPGSGADDKSSVFAFTGGSVALTGNKKGAFQSASSTDDKKENAFVSGATTRLNLKASLEKSGLGKIKIGEEEKDAIDAIFNGNDTATFKINDKDITIKKTDSINDILKKINDESGAGVTVSYQEAADKFTFTSTEKGASGTIKFDAASKNIVNALFGIDIAAAGDEVKDNDGNTVGYETRGKDAIVSVKYAGSDDVVELRRDSNSFTVDGLTIGVKGTFNTDYYDENDTWIKDKEIDPDKSVEIEASVDVDKLYNTIKDFVDSYNSIVELVNKELTTKHEKDYTPLTSDQKSELSDDEIEKWETKAKEGLLYGDSDLRSLSMDLRVVVSGGLLVEFEKIGISVSSTYSDNGKLSIDESKLRGALQTDPENVQKLFTSTAGVDEKGKQTYNGLATNLKSVMNKYVNTMGAMESKGILIRKAGSKSSALSLTQNTYYDQMKSIDKLLETLKAKLKTEQDRYIKQFSSLETLIANMNSQSSYLSSMSGY